MPKNIVFLDIDGVVNTLQISTKPFSSKERKHGGFYFDLCDITDDRVSNIQAIMWLNKLCKDTDAGIVITSTWRRFERDSHTVEKCLRNSGLLDDIPIIGATPYLNGEIRGREIEDWLLSNDIKGNYVILDDDMDMGSLINHLVNCNVHNGLTYNEYILAKNILNG